MSDYPKTFDYMLAAWNEADPSLVRSHLDKALAPGVPIAQMPHVSPWYVNVTLAPGVRFVDPSIDVTGIDGFETNVHEVKAKHPGNVYSRTSAVDSQHGFHRYHWAIHSKEGDLVLPGFDVVETDEDGRVVCVIGFFGELPKSL